MDLHDVGAQRWLHFNTWTSAILEGVERGAPIREMARGVPGPALRAESRVRRFVFALAQMGYVEIPVPQPETFPKGWRVQRELGRGGVGIAYLCRGPGSEQAVVKRAWDFVQPYDATERAMRNEALVLRDLSFPGVVRLLDTFELDGHLHLVREFVDGESLERYVGRGMPDPQAREATIRRVARILDHIHRAGYLLVDLRPANFFEAEDRVVLVDVGACHRMEGGAVRFAHRTGSPGFTSPEMRLAKTLTTRSDVWGLGRLYAFLATGEQPPRDDALAALLPRLDPASQAIVATWSADDPLARPGGAADAIERIFKIETRG